MSQWTHVTLTAEITSPGWKSPQELKAQVIEQLNHDSGITGSERDAQLFVIPLESNSTLFQENKEYHYFEQALIVVHGHLRDRTKEETEDEVRNFIRRLENQFNIIKNLQYNIWENGEELWSKITNTTKML